MDLYDGIADSCLRRAEGDQQKADYLFDTGYWNYYWRVKNWNKYKEATRPKNNTDEPAG